MLIRERRADKKSFSGRAIDAIARHRRMNVSPHVDQLRFPGTDLSRQFSVATVHKIEVFIEKNQDRLNKLADSLSDDQSRSALQNILAYRAVGPSHFTFENASALETKQKRAVATRGEPTLADFPPFEMFHHQYTFEGVPIKVECWTLNVLQTVEEKQYYADTDQGPIAPQEGDIIIDAGGCFGDTALVFAASVGKSGHIHSFEPLPRQQEVFRRNLAANQLLSERISLHPFATSDKSGDRVFFSDAGASARASSSGQVEVQTLSIDDFVDRNQVARVDFIKMDIEGAEMAALRGSRRTIERHMPRLAISVYHSLDDFLDIPEIVAQFSSNYNLYLRHHTTHAEETVLYATPRV
jgi:FkbM family methyltransferase